VIIAASITLIMSMHLGWDFDIVGWFLFVTLFTSFRNLALMNWNSLDLGLQ